MDSEGYIDLSQMADIYVIAQDGVTKQKYTVEIQTPSFVAPGRIGYKSLLFGFQQPLLILEVSFLQITVV